ncbi:MAG: class I SAM-dependent methyltransferase, partial [Fidelibacterota bacterium]
IISIAALHHGKIGDIRKLIKEMKRVLKPHGLIFVTLHKKLPKKKIPKEKLYGIKYIAPRTYVILGGPEKGGIHYNFNQSALLKLDYAFVDYGRLNNVQRFSISVEF